MKKATKYISDLTDDEIKSLIKKYLTEEYIEYSDDVFAQANVIRRDSVYQLINGNSRIAILDDYFVNFSNGKYLFDLSKNHKIEMYHNHGESYLTALEIREKSGLIHPHPNTLKRIDQLIADIKNGKYYCDEQYEDREEYQEIIDEMGDND